jgi:hypothetical protein
MAVDGMSEDAVIAAFASKGFAVTAVEARRAAYEATRDRNPFAAAALGEQLPEVYREGAAIDHATVDALEAVKARALATVPTAALPAPAAGPTPTPTTPPTPGAAK